MKDATQLRRHLHIIRLVDRPFTYPTLKVLSAHLRDHDLDKHSIDTIERDLHNIRGEYGIDIAYDRSQRGYFLNIPDDEDLSDFRAFVRLLEVRERFEMLTRAGSQAGRYLQLEQHDGFRGLDLLSTLHQAMQRQLVVTFTYRTYSSLPDVQQRTRRIEPGLLFEYRNRWYLDGYDLDVPNRQTGERTFGLDRIDNLQLTPQPFRPDRGIDYRAARQHVIGVTAPPDQQPERVVLRFTGVQREYVQSLPLHHSQRVESTDYKANLTVSLYVKCNPELEREILAFGQFVEVLEPHSLRKEIGERVRLMAGLYADQP
ncbi:helix-turn-helix transcriptional regulator [Fibrella sp. WM1]|uniref:helix-turn-helix transcriptional regulator n=1 Tax=Fibrella musci TaxID=3242485 RepID=UPI003521197F